MLYFDKIQKVLKKSNVATNLATFIISQTAELGNIFLSWIAFICPVPWFSLSWQCSRYLFSRYKNITFSLPIFTKKKEKENDWSQDTFK